MERYVERLFVSQLSLNASDLSWEYLTLKVNAKNVTAKSKTKAEDLTLCQKLSLIC